MRAWHHHRDHRTGGHRVGLRGQGSDRVTGCGRRRDDFLFSLPPHADPRLATVAPRSINKRWRCCGTRCRGGSATAVTLDCAALVQPGPGRSSLTTFRILTVTFDRQRSGLASPNLPLALFVSFLNNWRRPPPLHGEAEAEASRRDLAARADSSTSLPPVLLPARRVRATYVPWLCPSAGARASKPRRDGRLFRCGLPFEPARRGTRAVRGATLAPATHFHLSQRGGIARAISSRPGCCRRRPVAFSDRDGGQHGVRGASRAIAGQKTSKQRISVGAASIRARASFVLRFPGCRSPWQILVSHRRR